MVRLDPTEKEVVFCPFTVRAMLSGPSEREKHTAEEKHTAFKISDREGLYMGQLQKNLNDTVLLTDDGQVYLITGAVTDSIKHMTAEWSLVIAGHIDYSESRVSISELNSVADCNLRAVVHPEEREGRPRGDRACEDC